MLLYGTDQMSILLGILNTLAIEVTATMGTSKLRV